MSKVQIKEFDAADYLRSDEDIATYLDAIVQEGDPALFASALGDVARARGMSALARDAGLSRETLYRSLSGQTIPSSDTIFRVISALGMKVSIRPARRPATEKKHVSIASKSRQLTRKKLKTARRAQQPLAKA